MARKKTDNSRPTDAELLILSELWKHGPQTIKEIEVRLNDTKAWNYTTVGKLLQLLQIKGLVVRDESARAHVYRATPKAEAAQKNLFNELVERVFGGSVTQLMQHAVGSKQTTAAELDEIQVLIDQAKKELQHGK